MVDELTQESFQTGKAIVTVSVDLITAIADACKRSEQQNPGMSEEQKETLLGKVVDKVMSNYKETHGSLKGFNREGKDVMKLPQRPMHCPMSRPGAQTSAIAPKGIFRFRHQTMPVRMPAITPP